MNVENSKQVLTDLFYGRTTKPIFTNAPSRIPIWKNGDYSASDKPLENWLPWVIENYSRHVKLSEVLQDVSVPVALIMTGTQIFANAFGCKVFVPENNNPCAEPLVDNFEDADKLEIPDIWKTPCLYRIFEMASLVRDELGKDVDLGVPDIQTGFDVANLIWDKTDFLCSLLLEPDAVKRLSFKCATLVKNFLIEFRKEFPNSSPCHCPNIWSPPELGPWLSNDEVGMLSPDQFMEFCYPELEDLSKTFGGIGMHCCANAEYQFENFKKIPNFYAFNRVKSKQGYMPLLDVFNDKDSPVHVLAWIKDHEIYQLLENASPDTRFIFVNMKATIESGKLWLDKFTKWR